MPLLDSSLYDCIVDTGNQLYRVQIKSTTKKPDKTHHTSVHVPLQNNKKNYDKNKIDFFAVWCDFYSGFFIFKNTGKMQSIRLSKTGRNKIFFNNFAFS